MERTFEQSRINFISKVMNHMGIGLFITFVVAYFTSMSQSMQALIYGQPFVYIILAFAEIGLVVYISRRMDRMTLAQARTGFYAYAALNGLTLSVIFMVYALPAIYSAFIVAAVMFLAAGFIGMTIKKDLSAMGHFLMLVLIGIIIVSIINMFIPSLAMYNTISFLGVVVFSGLTAYDMQRLKNIHQNSYYFDEEMAGKYSILGALTLYLDFINLFLYLLRLFGRKR